MTPEERFRMAMEDAESEDLDNLRAGAEMFDRVTGTRDARVVWNGKTGVMPGWAGPDTPDGGSHLAFGQDDPRITCPCGWTHRIQGDRRIVSVRMVPPPP